MIVLSGMWVLDASVVVRAFIEDELTEHARRVLDAVCSTGRAVAPELLHIECASAVWKYVRFRGMSIRRAENIVGAICALGVRTEPLRELTQATLLLAAKTGVSVYDACYLATAISQGAGLVTADMKLVRGAKPTGIRIVHLADAAQT